MVHGSRPQTADRTKRQLSGTKLIEIVDCEGDLDPSEDFTEMPRGDKYMHVLRTMKDQAVSDPALPPTEEFVEMDEDPVRGKGPGGSEVNVHAEAVAAARPLARLVEIVREDPEAARG